MLHPGQRLRPGLARKMVIASCLAITIVLTYFFFSPNASAYSTQRATSVVNGPILQVTAGFNARFRDGNWIPVQINLSNNGAEFDGTISINAPVPYNGPGTSSSVYSEPISLANGTQKQVIINIPVNLGGQGNVQDIHVNLLDASGNIVRTQISKVSSLGQSDIFTGILSDQNTGFSPLYSIALPNQGGSMIVEPLNASNLPDTASVLKNFDLLVLDNFTTSNLNADQLTALQSWVDQGGELIEVGGPEWRRTLSSLPTSLLPVAVTGTSTLPAGTPLLPVISPVQTGQSQINATVPISVGTLAQANTANTQSTTVLSAGTTPLIVQSKQGQGIVCYLAFDPTLAPIVTWSGTNTLWHELVLRLLGDKMLGSNNLYAPGGAPPTTGLGGLLQGLLTNNLPSPWLLLALLLGYLVILGPVRFLIIRWRKRRDWSWRIVLASIAVFSLLTYGLAIQQKGTTVLSNSVSIIRLDQDGTLAHISTFVGVFVPNQGNYQVHIPANGLVQPSDDQYDPTNSSGQNTTINSTPNSTDVNLQGVKIWTLRSLVSERDRSMHGGIESHLTYQNYRLTGTVTNTLGYALSDVYILMINSYVRIGSLAAGQTMQVNVNMHTFGANSNMSMADQLAQSYNLPTPYSSYISSGNTPQNELQRHLAILSALSGNGNGIVYSSCGGGAVCSMPLRGASIVSQGKFFFSGGGPGTATGNDPLLLANAPATLIGWANQPVDSAQNVTINGSTPTGLQETLLQTPLNLHLSGTLHLPPSFIPGQIVDIQGTNVQNQYGGYYTITTGSITFEFTIPESNGLHINSLAVSQSSNQLQTYGPPVQNGTGAVVDASHFHASLYNWQTGTWDAFKLKGLNLSTTNVGAYVGPGGRVLVQYANQDSSIGTIYFGKPSLDLQGIAS
jgi:hypothetical protein